MPPRMTSVRVDRLTPSTRAASSTVSISDMVAGSFPLEVVCPPLRRDG